MKIGTVEFKKYPVFAAPMEDVSEPSFRYMCKKHGADMLYTEFASCDAIIRNVNKTAKKMITFEYERPVAVQIFGRDPQTMAEAAIIAVETKPDILDINFGCPVKKIAGKGAGSGLLRNLPLMKEITDAVVKAVNIPVTAKTRLGWDENDKPIEYVTEMLQDCGIQALTIHGRTRAQMYTGEADWTLIGDVKNNPRIHIPIIGNGDIDSAEKAKLYFDRYGVDAIMIGRASIGNPWIFRDVKHFLNTGEHIAPFTLLEQIEELKEFTLKSIEFKGLPGGVIHMRRQFARSFRGLENFKETRVKLLNLETLEDVMALLDEIGRQY
jgi:nifR3 family TIM-barrel protein